MSAYKLTNNGSILRLCDGAYIPNDEANTDYQEYLRWVSLKGNDPLPADPEPKPSYMDLRKAAFTVEADPLFFQEQRGEVPAGTWIAKVEEIKKRFPKETE